MAIIVNKDLIQSYILTTARYDFSVYEKRILYRIVEMLQDKLKGLTLDKNYSIQDLLFDDKLIQVPIQAFLLDEEDKNYARVKKALIDLEGKKFEYDDEKNWKLLRLIHKPTIDKLGSFVTFELVKEVYDAFLSFSKGFRKLELKTAMQFTSVYSMRFYELLSNQKTPLTYSIEHLKIMFQVENKYKRNDDFIKRIVIQAKTELDKKSPYSFTYKLIKTGRQITHIVLFPVYQKEFRDVELEKKQSNPSAYYVKNNITTYLKQTFGFTNDGINKNIELIQDATKKFDLLLELSKLKAKALKAANTQGYVINALKKMLINKEEKSTKTNEVNNKIQDLASKFKA